MHSASLQASETINGNSSDILVAVSALVTEGRIPEKLHQKSKGFYEGPHSCYIKTNAGHKCDQNDSLCMKYENLRVKVLDFWKKEIPLCIEVVLTCGCFDDTSLTTDDSEHGFLLERWLFNVSPKRSAEAGLFNTNQLVNAIRSQLYFSQITAWLSPQNETKHILTNKNISFRVALPGETTKPSKFTSSAIEHKFPATDIGHHILRVNYLNLPRMSDVPLTNCPSCTSEEIIKTKETRKHNKEVVDDRMHVQCTIKGKHHCEEFEEATEHAQNDASKIKRMRSGKDACQASTSAPNGLPTSKLKKLNIGEANRGKESPEKRHISPNDEHLNKFAKWSSGNDLRTKNQDKAKILLDAIERSARDDTKRECDTSSKIKICDSPIPKLRSKKLEPGTRSARQRLCFDDVKSNNGAVPTPTEKETFRKSFGNAASMVFHSRTGLPLTSSPAPVRRGNARFEFDSSINSVSAIKSAIFSTSFSTDDESESDGSLLSPCSPEIYTLPKEEVISVKYRRKGHAANLLGSFEESVLNGRLEPVSTVQGFRAELGASGAFVPKHLIVPVTVFFYTLGDNDKVSSPYLGHINLGKKGYNVPKMGTVQVTLFNPLGTVVKMFVIMYDLSDMPANSQTFIRQRTLYMPTNCQDENLEWGPKWLRYLIHLRFMSSKSGKIYLHSDIRMIIFRKSDMDTATALGIDMSYELRSFTHMPANPKFSPRK